MNHRTCKWCLVLVALALVTVFGWGVWPSHYTYSSISMFGGPVDMRTDTITGKTEISGEDKWYPVDYNDGHLVISKGTKMVVGGPTCSRVSMVTIVTLILLGLAEFAFGFILLRRVATRWDT